ncbi:hypothetical protein B0T24DRAFT_574141 [Lasiosphaeria ovina]|uniref:RBR-type E3 ubiquitin transferase n=1 Tax=Lasiosphaeria ovina TaxID=92902 RepID=A0AAE0KHT9_9PEZI|nr:hypothetical protein B0T24DRAFT_574141 [Lasiosphaeria ovina]
MASGLGAEVYDLLLLVDATASMGEYLKALNKSLQDLIRISALTSCFSRIGVLAYRDYYGGPHVKVTEWSGWYGREDGDSDITQDALLAFASQLTCENGGDWPEAAKSGLAHCYDVMRSGPAASTVVVLFADAPPHTDMTGGEQHVSEQQMLSGGASYTAALFLDWASAAHTLRHGEKRAQVFSIIESGSYLQNMASYGFLSAKTGGVCVDFLSRPSSAEITTLTIGLLLAWMGAEKPGAALSSHQLARVIGYKDGTKIDHVTSENAEVASQYLLVSRDPGDVASVQRNLTYTPLSLASMAQLIPRRAQPVTSFSARYSADAAYREVVVAQLDDIIWSDVTAMAHNPVFGTLWRAVCSDRHSPARDTLMTSFSQCVDRLPGGHLGPRQHMRAWLDESYNRSGEIRDIISSVPAASRFPCVFVDPTLVYGDAVDDDDDDADKDEASSDAEEERRDLLEIGRSCRPRVLRLLGRLLTRMTYVESEAALPQHIWDVPEHQVARIPLALAQPQHGRQFWRVLLHADIPGTMLTARPAALLAALSLRMGIRRLEDAAYAELRAWSGRWNDPTSPETFNMHCLTLLLDADQQHRDGTTTSDRQGILQAGERALFQALVNYKLLELNLDTALTATVGWTPDRTKLPPGPTVQCTRCHLPRSVTVMADGGVCGLCAFGFTAESSDVVAWVECSAAHCRAQYTLYLPARLRVRPKCHYCRANGRLTPAARAPAPCVTCATCRSRVIWPAAYRPPGFDEQQFQCVGCASSCATTTVDIETTARALLAENGAGGWLLRNDGGEIPIPRPFEHNKTLFQLLQSARGGAQGFADSVAPLPPLDPGLALTLDHRPLLNAQALVNTLRTRVDARTVQHAETCSLCFRTSKSSLRLACGGRAGCRSRICAACMSAWYGGGGNARGRLLHMPALLCPFCRRAPVAGRMPAALFRELRHLGGLRAAVAESVDGGRWRYAWCARCGFARRFAERVCRPPGEDLEGDEEVSGWQCDDCTAWREEDGPGTVRACPKCLTPTERMGGCHHIACTIPGCGADWCFECGLQFAVEDIYRHMGEEHGGWYGFDEDGGGDEDGDEWDE